MDHIQDRNSSAAPCLVSVPAIVSAAKLVGAKKAHATSYVTLIKGDSVQTHNQVMHVLMHQLLLQCKMCHLLFLANAGVGGIACTELTLVSQSGHLCGNGLVDGLLICFFGG